MNVKQLREMLEGYPDNMEIISDRFSDYQVISDGVLRVVAGVANTGEWIMRSHPTMSAENKAKEKQYLLLEGN